MSEDSLTFYRGAACDGGLFDVGPTGLTPFGSVTGNIWTVASTPTGLWALGEKELHFLDESGTTTFVSPFP